MKMKNNLDERQEQTLLKIEHNGCWFAFWGLLVALIAQQFIFGFDFKYIAGEWIVFMVLCIYLAGACVKNGIWDRHLQANSKTNLLASLVAGVVFGGILFAAVKIRYGIPMTTAALSGLIGGVFVFVACYIGLSVTAAIFKRRAAALEKEDMEEE